MTPVKNTCKITRNKTKLKQKFKQVFKSSLPLKTKFSFFAKLIVKLHLNVCNLKTSKGSKVSTSYKTSNDFGKSCFTNLLPH